MPKHRGQNIGDLTTEQIHNRFSVLVANMEKASHSKLAVLLDQLEEHIKLVENWLAERNPE